MCACTGAGRARISHKGMHVPADEHSLRIYTCLSLQKPHTSRHSRIAQGLGMNDNTWVEGDWAPLIKKTRPSDPNHSGLTPVPNVILAATRLQDCLAPLLPIQPHMQCDTGLQHRCEVQVRRQHSAAAARDAACTGEITFHTHPAHCIVCAEGVLGHKHALLRATGWLGST